MPYVLVDEVKGEEWVLREGKYTLGRKGTDLIANNAAVSKKHAEFRAAPLADPAKPNLLPHLFLTDVSTYGTKARGAAAKL